MSILSMCRGILQHTLMETSLDTKSWS
ncbi:hypothetical protein GBAR_LOCUS14769 [Geodia barretti]|uniref:Uncharacterized protein n=1 Tax=Geodia barretti TaxID=519541 RepID=A0AA35SB54_GEOBA|nr:hypothetical protein GBAR_LOCUS14769 [Geodia barretti]